MIKARTRAGFDDEVELVLLLDCGGWDMWWSATCGLDGAVERTGHGGVLGRCWVLYGRAECGVASKLHFVSRFLRRLLDF
jgi:hypothetical protein